MQLELQLKKIASLGMALVAAWIFGTPFVQAEGLVVTDPKVVEAFVDGAVKPVMKKDHSPSGVVAVMKDGKMIFAKGYGYQNVEQHIPVDPKTTMFRPGSISKLFTWIAVMQMAEQGKLDIDTDVNVYLKTFKVKDSWPGQPVTLRHIMTHTAGFEDGSLGYLIVDDPAKIMPLADSLAMYQPERVKAPGEIVAYSNWGTALAGLIVENVSGLEFNAYIQKYIFDVLGMSRSTFVEPLPDHLEPLMAKGYIWQGGKYVEQDYEIIANFGPAGAAAVTAYDMTRLACALLNDGACEGNRILKPETLQQMIDEGFSHDPRVRGTGLGFLKRDLGPDGFDNFGHDGATTLFLSHFGLSKKENFMLFTSFSGPGGRAAHNALVKSFYDEFFPQELPVVAPEEDFATRALKYAGTYHNSRNSYSKIEALMRPLSEMKVAVLPDNSLMIGDKRYVEVDKNLFREVDDTGRIAFQEDKDGVITGFVLDGFGVMRFYRAPFYETGGFNFLILGVSMIVFAGVFLRLAYQWSVYRAMPVPARRAMEASFLVAGLNLLTLILAVWAFRNGLGPVMYELPFSIKLSVFVGTMATLAAFYHLLRAVLVWREGLFSGWWARTRYTVVTVCALLMAWFYFYWNIFGFNYFS
ncbi:serine hydrolase domain-containing protein [Emcibacter sp.]|uniref:serine hydrolase domain-containing protein n=1 Tax=Emcibacter sp. TaxID=1979954 RepID=UPI003A90B5F1